MTKKTKDLKLEVCIPSELPVYRFESGYGSIAIYSPTSAPITQERILLLLEKAKFQLLYNPPV